MRRLLILFILVASLVLLATIGGSIFDLVGLNVVSLRTLEAQAAELWAEPVARTESGACKLAHTIGRFYLTRQQYERALPYLERGVACDTGRLAGQWAWFDLALAQLALGDRPSATASLARADGYEYATRLAQQAAADKDRQGQIDMWRLAISVDPSRQTSYIHLASLYVENEPDQAEALFQQAIANNLSEPAAYLALANFYSRRGQVEAASEVLIDALAQVPEDVAVLAALAANARARGQISQAVDYYQRVAVLSESDEERSAAYYAIGDLTAADNNRVSALTFYRLAVAGDPEKPAYLLALSKAYQFNGCPDEAGQLFRRLLALAPDVETVATVEAGLAEIAGEATEPGIECPPLP